MCHVLLSLFVYLGNPVLQTGYEKGKTIEKKKDKNLITITENKIMEKNDGIVYSDNRMEETKKWKTIVIVRIAIFRN
jgi:hypothetical protein